MFGRHDAVNPLRVLPLAGLFLAIPVEPVGETRITRSGPCLVPADSSFLRKVHFGYNNIWAITTQNLYGPCHGRDNL